MSSYVITGASRGIGLEYVRQLAAIPGNTVLAVVRNPESPAIAELASKNPNVHAIKGDVTDPRSILRAAEAASAITGGSLDVIIHNSNTLDMGTFNYSPTQFPFDADAMRATFDAPLSTAVYGGMWTTNAFLPLIEKGTLKKIVHISTGMANPDIIKKAEMAHGVPYTVAKAGMNIQVAKYAVELAPKGIKVLAISPGWVDTWEGDKPPQLIEAYKVALEKFQQVDPKVKGEIMPEESVRKQLQVIDKLDAEMSGSFVSHNLDGSWF